MAPPQARPPRPPGPLPAGVRGRGGGRLGRGLGGEQCAIIDEVPQWWLDGHRKEPTGRPPGRPTGRQGPHAASPPRHIFTCTYLVGEVGHLRVADRRRLPATRAAPATRSPAWPPAPAPTAPTAPPPRPWSRPSPRRRAPVPAPTPARWRGTSRRSGWRAGSARRPGARSTPPRPPARRPPRPLPAPRRCASSARRCPKAAAGSKPAA